MIKANWHVFASKFSDNPQENFEWLCYLLFCSEYNKPNGITGYINQSAIEYEPIEVENDYIGFQAKYYSVSLTKRKNELINILKKTKLYYPRLTKLLVYTNQKWGKNKNQCEPSAKQELERKADALGIKIEWRDDNFFKSPNIAQSYDSILTYFFTQNPYIIETIRRFKSHTENILSQIHNEIFFSGKCIRINKISDVEKIQKSDNQIILISGQGGVGKTALIKQLYDLNQYKPYFLFKATEFDINALNAIFYESNIDCFIDILKNDQDKTLIIDSAEKLLDIKNTDPIKELLVICVRENWKIIFTTRDSYIEDLNYLFIEIYNLAPLHIRVNPLTNDELLSLSNDFSFKLPTDEKLIELIRIPFYLSEYLNAYSNIQGLNYNKFKNTLWSKTVLFLS